MSGAPIGATLPNILAQAARARASRPARSGAPHPTGAPVRRGSLEEGTFEDEFFTVPAKGETDTLLTRGRKLLDAGRRLKKRWREGQELTALERALAALTDSSIRIFEAICTLARLNHGRVFPSYDWLTNETCLARRTIARGLKVLEGAGLIIRQRRFKRVTDDEGEDRYKQTSNAYRSTFLEKALAYLPGFLRPAPRPEDEIQRDNDRQEETTRMLDGLSCVDRARYEVAEGSILGGVLQKLGARIDARCECHDGAQPLS